jgi:hypothetical protein
MGAHYRHTTLETAARVTAAVQQRLTIQVLLDLAVPAAEHEPGVWVRPRHRLLDHVLDPGPLPNGHHHRHGVGRHPRDEGHAGSGVATCSRRPRTRRISSGGTPAGA